MIATVVQEVTQAEHADGVPDARAADAETAPTLPGSWEGVVVTSARGWFGQYTIRHWYGNRTVYVCGDAAGHVAAGYWLRDRRMDGNGQGYVCCRCFAYESGLYGIQERR